MSRKNYRGLVVWITGGGSGIGRELALEMARRGARVALSGRRQDRLEEVADEIRALGADALPLACDVTDEAQIQRTVETILETWEQLDVVVANAGFSVSGRIENIDADAWRRQLDVNVVGVAMTARHTLAALRQTQGRIAIVGSVAGVVSSPGSGPYHASKYAVRAIGQTLAMELYSTGVTCTLVQPGFVESEIAQVDNQGHYDPNRPDPRPKKYMWPADRAARAMADAIHDRKREFTFTGFGKVAAFLGQHAPGLVHTVVTRSGKQYKRRAPAPKDER